MSTEPEGTAYLFCSSCNIVLGRYEHSINVSYDHFHESVQPKMSSSVGTSLLGKYMSHRSLLQCPKHSHFPREHRNPDYR